MKKQLAIVFILAFPFFSLSQDSTLIKKIDSISQYNYDHADTILYYLTTTDFFNAGSSTQVQLYKFKNKNLRIVCMSRHAAGTYAIEFYLLDELPVFIFETTSYAREKAPSWSEKNFQNIHASDHRYYFWDKKLVHNYGTGTDPNRSVSRHSEKLKAACTNIINWCKAAQ